MKKFFILIFMAVIMCFVLAGCVDSTEQIPSDINDGNNTEQSTDTNEINKGDISEMFITVNGNELKVTLANNSSVDALVEELKQGEITYTADDYGGFEKVGNIGLTLPRNDTQITTQAGDVILYQGNSICLYYGTNSWSFTRIGKINGYSDSVLRVLLGAGKGRVQVTISLETNK